MVTRRFKDLVAQMPLERQERVRARAEEMRVIDANLATLRKLTGLTQVQMADKLKVTQGQVSEAERRKDHLVSTLKSYVSALGGRVEVIARVGKKTVRLQGV